MTKFLDDPNWAGHAADALADPVGGDRTAAPRGD